MSKRDNQRCDDLIACYLTGQMSEAQWQEHLAHEPGLAERARVRRFGGGEMPRYQVTVEITSTKRIGVWAANEDEAEEKAVDIVIQWDGVNDAEAIEVEAE